MSPTLTPKQKEILDFIEGFSAENGYAPSQQEIAQHFGFKSLGTVQNYLVRLERQGALRKTLNARRGMEVVNHNLDSHPAFSSTPATGSVPLPLLGRVAAGRPIEAIPNEDTFDVPASLIKGGDHFVLRVTGASMIEDGILDGDYVVIRKQDGANNGQTVVALVGNEATLKRYYRRGNKIELHPANPAYQPLIIEGARARSAGAHDESSVESTDFHIEGVLVGLIRRFAS
jgi:repressor LexA